MTIDYDDLCKRLDVWQNTTAGELTDDIKDAKDAIAALREQLQAKDAEIERLKLIYDGAFNEWRKAEADNAALREQSMSAYWSAVQERETGAGLSHEDGWTLMRTADADALKNTLIHLHQAYANKHSPQHRAAALGEAAALLAGKEKA